MAEEILKRIRRVGLDDFDSDPRNPGAVGIFKDSTLAETIRLLAEYPAATLSALWGALCGGSSGSLI